MEVWDRDIIQTPEGAFHATPEGLWPLPAGLVLNQYPTTEDGLYAEPHAAFVDSDGHVKPFRTDELGFYPSAVNNRMNAEQESRRRVEAMQTQPQPTVRPTVRVGDHFQELTPTVPMAFTEADQKRLNALVLQRDVASTLNALKTRAEQATSSWSIGKAARRAASFMVGMLGVQQAKGRHHQPKLA